MERGAGVLLFPRHVRSRNADGRHLGLSATGGAVAKRRSRLGPASLEESAQPTCCVVREPTGTFVRRYDGAYL